MHSCFLTVYVQHILASKRLFLLHLGKGESEKLAVKQYESYNRGLALSDPSWLLIGWRTWSHPSHWLGPGCSLLLLQGLPASRTKVRNVATWDPPGLVSLRSFRSRGRLVCRSGGATITPSSGCQELLSVDWLALGKEFSMKYSQMSKCKKKTTSMAGKNVQQQLCKIPNCKL